MRKLYQTEWHGIPFTSFATLSSHRLADALFYKSFYQTFFQTYQDWEELDSDWVKLKLLTATFLKQFIGSDRGRKILSIGCGTGIIEKNLMDEGFDNLEMTEIADEPLHWIKPHVSQEKIHIGSFPSCLPQEKRYHLIYLAGVEYYLDQPQLINFLKDVKFYLYPQGSCLMISWSYYFTSWIKSFLHGSIDIVKYFCERAGLRHRGQWWGYLRKSEEFHQAMSSAGFKEIYDGFLAKTGQWDTYWISGSKE